MDREQAHTVVMTTQQQHQQEKLCS